MGERARAMLIERIETGRFPSREVVLPVELIDS
jgi:DNA-binding LacI/PurR family transcriptional regulator